MGWNISSDLKLFPGTADADSADRSGRSVLVRPSAPDSAIDHSRNPEAFGFRALPSRELKRRMWHMTPGLLAFVLHYVSHADPITPTLRWIVVACCLGIGLRILLGFSKIQRRGEGAGKAAVAGYAFSVLLTVLMFPRHLEIGVAVLSILAFGDGSATLLGLMFRGPRLPWNQGKSWSGFTGFITVGVAMTSWIYWGETWNAERSDVPVSFLTAVLLVTPAVVAAAFAESIRTKLNDNIRVGVVAAIAMSIMHFVFRPF